MTPVQSKMRIGRRKRKVFFVALMAISAGGCASSKSGRPSFATSEPRQEPVQAGGKTVSWEQVLAETDPAVETPVQPVAFTAEAEVEPIVIEAVPERDPG